MKTKHTQYCLTQNLNFTPQQNPLAQYIWNSIAYLFIKFVLKLQEFERALHHRDNLIEDLTTSLEQALASRDALLAQITLLNTSEIGNRTNGDSDHDGKVMIFFFFLHLKNYEFVINSLFGFHRLLHLKVY